MLLPQATAFADMPSGPVAVTGYLSSPKSLGRAARLTADALEAQGRDVRRHDITRMWSGAVPRLPDDVEVWIVQDNPPTFEHVVMATPRSRRPRYLIGYWTWEQPRCPPSWRRAATAVNEIWVPSKFVEEAARATFGSAVEIKLAPHPVPICETRIRDHERRPRLLLAVELASFHERKNPQAGLLAMLEARRAGVDFLPVIKIPGDLPRWLRWLVEEIERLGPVERVSAYLSDADMDALLLGCDGVLSLHRAEGFGLVPAEAVAAGIPVIATDYSGTTDFVTEATGYPVRWRPVEAPRMSVGFDPALGEWAEPDIGHAVECIAQWARDHSSGTTRRNQPALGEKLLGDQIFPNL